MLWQDSQIMSPWLPCSDSMVEPACTVHVRLEYQFRTILGLPPLPSSIEIGRDSRFRVSDLAPP